MIGMRQRVEDDGITAEYVMTDPPANSWEDERPGMTNWYSVTLEYQGRTLTVPFGMGVGLTDDPTPEDVINSLALDASGYENARDFEDWASEYGYDTASRKAYNTYQQVAAFTEQLKTFLGEEYSAYLYETEGL